MVEPGQVVAGTTIAGIEGDQHAHATACLVETAALLLAGRASRQERGPARRVVLAEDGRETAGFALRPAAEEEVFHLREVPALGGVELLRDAAILEGTREQFAVAGPHEVVLTSGAAIEPGAHGRQRVGVGPR